MLGDLKITAVVVTYNRKELLRECLKALLNQTRPLDEIIVIDNASSDGTKEMININFSHVTYIQLSENIGGAGGFHEGIKIGYEKGHDWIWIMDDDAVPASNSLEKLLDAIEFIGDKIGKSCLCSHIIDNEKLNTIPNQVVIELVSSAIFVGFAINSNLVKTVGLPRPDFFIYYDDIEYCYRIRQAGGEIFKVAGSIIYHKDWTHQSIICRKILCKIIETPRLPKWKFYYLARNNILRSSYSIKAKFDAILMGLELWIKVLLTQPQCIGLLTLGIIHGIIGVSGKRIDPLVHA